MVEADLSDIREIEFEAGCLMEVLRAVARVGAVGGIWNLAEPVVFLFLVDLGTLVSRDPRGK